MNTEIEPNKSTEEWGAKSATNRTSDSAANLEARLSQEQDSRKEERFYWVFAVILLIDAIVFPGMEKIPLSIITAFEFVLLIGLADFLGVDRVVTLLENLLNRNSK